MIQNEGILEGILDHDAFVRFQELSLEACRVKLARGLSFQD